MDQCIFWLEVAESPRMINQVQVGTGGNAQMAFGFIVLGIATAAVLWRVKE